MTVDEVDEKTIAIINSIVERQLNVLKEIAEDGDQAFDDVYSELIAGIKKQFKKSLDNLTILYEDFIDQDGCNLAVALQYVPLFVVYGLWLGAQLGVSQEEFYGIVDHYLKKYDLLEE